MENKSFSFLLLSYFMSSCPAEETIVPLPIIQSKASFPVHYNNKKSNQIYFMYKEIQNGAVAKSYMRKGSLIYEEMRKYLTIHEEAVSHI
jgi:hypothetical protein